MSHNTLNSWPTFGPGNPSPAGPGFPCAPKGPGGPWNKHATVNENRHICIWLLEKRRCGSTCDRMKNEVCIIGAPGGSTGSKIVHNFNSQEHHVSRNTQTHVWQPDCPVIHDNKREVRENMICHIVINIIPELFFFYPPKCIFSFQFLKKGYLCLKME